MKRMLMLGLPVVFVACADGTPTQPASSAGQAALGAVSSSLTGASADAAIYHFYDCVGIPGGSTTITAQKTRLPEASGNPVASASAFRLVDGSGVFIVLSYGEGFFSPPGIEYSGNATVTCKFNSNVGLLEISGFLAPAA